MIPFRSFLRRANSLFYIESILSVIPGSNYYLPADKGELAYYTALRVPQATENARLVRKAKAGSVDQEDLLKLEATALRSSWRNTLLAVRVRRTRGAATGLLADDRGSR